MWVFENLFASNSCSASIHASASKTFQVVLICISPITGDEYVEVKLPKGVPKVTLFILKDPNACRAGIISLQLGLKCWLKSIMRKITLILTLSKLMFLLAEVSHCKNKTIGKREPPTRFFFFSCSRRPHLWPKLTVLKQALFNLECSCPIKTARWKFLCPQLLSRKLVLYVVSHVT